MYLLFAILAALIGTAIFEGSLGNVPFSKLTLNIVLSNLIASSCFIGAIHFGFKSLENDRIWPWRWTLSYFGNLMIRFAYSASFLFCIVTLMEEKHVAGLSLVIIELVACVILLYTLFSSEFEQFKDKVDKQ
jgi:hypothetical protein